MEVSRMGKNTLHDVGDMLRQVASAKGVQSIKAREHWQSEEQAFADAACVYVATMDKAQRHIRALVKLFDDGSPPGLMQVLIRARYPSNEE